ncbi:hypothetical protein ABBQ38_000328 [Trebouxia sp. C0009 RCD-2024]
MSMTVDLFVGGPPSCKEQQPSVAWRNHALFASRRTVASLDDTATHVTKQFVAAMYLYSVKAVRPVASCTTMHAPVSGGVQRILYPSAPYVAADLATYIRR